MPLCGGRVRVGARDGDGKGEGEGGGEGERERGGGRGGEGKGEGDALAWGPDTELRAGWGRRGMGGGGGDGCIAETMARSRKAYRGGGQPSGTVATSSCVRVEGSGRGGRVRVNGLGWAYLRSTRCEGATGRGA